MRKRGHTRATKAWLVRWEWAGAHAEVDQPIAAILPCRWGADSIKRVVEALYAAREFDPVDMLAAARAPRDAPYRAHNGTVCVTFEDGSRGNVAWTGEVLCGHNPYLVARLARVWEDEQGHVRWEDLPRPTPDFRGADYRHAAPLVPTDDP